MLVICSLILVVVGLIAPTQERRKLAGLTFATVDEKMDVIPLEAAPRNPARGDQQ